MKSPFVSLIILTCLCLSCSDKEFDAAGFNREIQNKLHAISLIESIEKFEKFYYLVGAEGDTIQIPATEFENGVIYVKDIIKNESYYNLKLSNGDVSNIPCTVGAEIKYRVPNISSLRLDGYDIQMKVVLKDKSSLLRINHGEPNIGGLVCSSFIDFANSRIGYYKPYTTNGEETTEVLIESNQIIPFVEEHEYTIVSSKTNGCVASLSITDNETGEIYEFSPEIGCYESGITNGWGKSSYEVKGNIEVLDFRIYSNQDYNSKLLILGDSNADHGGIGDYKWRNYARQIKDGMGGSAFLVVQGGADTNHFLTWLEEYVLDICKPQYCLVTTYNESPFFEWHSNIMEIIQIFEGKNIIPILATIHSGGKDGIDDGRIKINEWIRGSNCLVFDVAKIVSLDHDGISVNKDLLQYDMVHYNFEANDLLASSFFEIFPFLRNN
ncbi:MAG: SGNH/GDSL hydrolase family protein [Aeriscardovia sp.]|nr:SGNH/GDSL hydrolase family protein [Aeriscardovia sp.]